MAEQSISLPVTPKSTDSDAGNSKNNSMGKASSSKSGGNIPNYLRASTGSCHDFCKYGKKHGFEEKARRPFLRRNAKKPPDEENSLEFQQEKNRMLQVKHKPNSNSETPPKTAEIMKWEASPKSLQRQSLSSADTAAKKMSAGVLFTKLADRQSPVLREILAKKKTTAREVLTESSESQKSVSSQNWVDRRNASAQERKKTATREVLTKSIDSQSSISGENSVEWRKTSIVKLGTSADSKTRLSPKMMKHDSSSLPEKLKVSLKHASSKEENISAKCTNSFELTLSSPGSSRVLNVGGNSDNKIGKKTVTSKIAGKRAQTSSRALVSPNSSSSGIVRGQVNQTSSLSLKPTLKLQMSPRVLLSSKTSSSGIARGLVSPRASITLKSSLSRVASQNARKHGGSEVVSHLINQNKNEKANSEHPKIKQADPDQSAEELKGPNNDVAQEKTLYIIKMETENKFLESDHKKNLSPELSPPQSSSLPESPLSSSHNEEDEDESEYTATDAEDDLVSEYDETESIEETDPPGEQKGRLRKPGMLHSEDKNNQPVKLQFRRGKVINIQPEHNSPRRLKFRQGRAIGENQNLKADGRRSFKKREAYGHANDSKLNSEKVVLRHQDAQGKKDAQGLFNNVIEETASKLVETRKSKVKALVGAFETVISLQDGKPTANTAS